MIVALPGLFSYLFFYSQLQYQCSVYSTIHYRPSTSPPYTLQSTTDQSTVLRILYSQLQYQYSVYSTINYRPSTSTPYTLKSTTDPVPVLRMLFTSLQTQYQSSVYSTVHHRHTIQSSIYSTYRLTSGSPYTQQSTTDPVPSLRIHYSPLQFQSFVHSTVIYRLGSGPPYTLQCLTVHVSVLHILYNSLQSQFLSSV